MFYDDGNAIQHIHFPGVLLDDTGQYLLSYADVTYR